MKNHFFSLIQFVIQTTLIELSKSNHLKQFFQLSVFTFTAFFSLPQSIIKGKVADKDGIPLAYATIFIKRTMHGTMSDPAAAYSLATKAPGKQTIIGSYVGCESQKNSVLLNKTEIKLLIKLKSGATSLDEVVTNAGTIKARNDRAVAVIQPIDIVTRAGSTSVGPEGAIETLPGIPRKKSVQVALSVLEGDTPETLLILCGLTVQKVFMDGLRVSDNSDNLTNRKNIGGYRYSFDNSMKTPALPALYQTFLPGSLFFINSIQERIIVNHKNQMI